MRNRQWEGEKDDEKLRKQPAIIKNYEDLQKQPVD